MALVQSASESLKQSNRRILVMGPRGTGKTTLSISASSFAGPLISGEHRTCKDVLLIQGDNEGVMGAMDVGLEPGLVLDMTDIDTWDLYQRKLVAGMKEVKPRIDAGEIKIIVIDLNWPARLIDKSIDPANQKDWKLVQNEGIALFRMLASLKGVTVIGNAQIKTSAVIAETAHSENVSHAKAIGGERSTYTVDLPKGIATMWLDNCSFIFTREAKRVRDAKGNLTRELRTLTQSSNKYEAKSRACSKLKPIEPGDRSLHALLSEAYGEAL